MPNKGEISVWGENAPSRPPGNQFATIVPGGAAQSLALDTSGALTLLGTGPIVNVSPPRSNDTFVAAAIGIQHAIALRKDHTIAQWGLMPVTTVASATVASPGASVSVPAKLAGKNVMRITAGGNFCLAIADYHLYQWGPGAGTPPDKGAFIDLAARNDYCLALREDGAIVGWGGNLFTAGSLRPSAAVALLPDWEFEDGYFIHRGPFIAIAAGNLQKDLPVPVPHVLALKPDGTVVGWGTNHHGELTPPPAPRFKAIAAGHGFSLGLDRDGTIHHWGDPGPGAVSPLRSGVVNALANVPAGKFASIGAAARYCAAVADDNP